MKRLIYSSVSALLLTAAIPAIVPTATAQMRFNFSAPFIADSGVANASGSSHFIHVAVTGYPLTDLLITLPSQSEKVQGVQVTNQLGKEVPTKIDLKDGFVTISFPQPVAPDDYLKVSLNGIETKRSDERVLYRISAKKQGLIGEIPIGTAMIRVSNGSN